jgi:DNA-binding NtrC family response regulator
MAKILVVDDDRAFRLSTAELLRQDGHQVAVAGDGQEAVDHIRVEPYDLVLLDLRMPGIDGISLVEVLRQWGHGVPILMISGVGTVSDAVKALHTGVDDFLSKPVEPDVLVDRVAQLLERRPQGDALASAPGNLIGRSPAMVAVFDAIRRVAPTDTTVLIIGETGTGKELVARAIHDASTRRSGPFVPVNCAALAEGVLESELFGHVRGAFSGAIRDHKGLFEAADGGTIFLDEIGDISARLQHRLLRVLQEKEVLPVGAVRAKRVDVRVIAATHRDLRSAIESGDFREDLFYRLHVFRIDIPPLRERRSDIPIFVERFLAGVPRGNNEVRPTCSPLAMRMLQAHAWPGNVRELLAVLESALLRTDGDRIEAQHLPSEIRNAISQAESPGAARYRGDVTEEDERSVITAALAQADGVKAVAADLLGMGRTTLWRKLKKYGLAGDEMHEEETKPSEPIDPGA